MRTHEDVVAIWTLPADGEQLEQVPELSVDVSADLDSQECPVQMQCTVTGASIHWTLASSTKISRALRHSSFTCASLIVSQRRS